MQLTKNNKLLWDLFDFEIHNKDQCIQYIKERAVHTIDLRIKKDGWFYTINQNIMDIIDDNDKYSADSLLGDFRYISKDFISSIKKDIDRLFNKKEKA